MKSLTLYTDKNLPASKREVMEPFVNLITKINPNLTNEEFGIIKQCIEEDEITSGELEYGLVQAYKDPDRYGKVEWNHIWKHIQIKRESFDPESARKFMSSHAD